MWDSVLGPINRFGSREIKSALVELGNCFETQNGEIYSAFRKTDDRCLLCLHERELSSCRIEIALFCSSSISI